MYIIVYNIIILMLLVVCRVSKVSHIALWPKKKDPQETWPSYEACHGNHRVSGPSIIGFLCWGYPPSKPMFVGLKFVLDKSACLLVN